MEKDWQRGLFTIKERIMGLKEENCWTDVSFVVGDELKSFQAHKIILAAASPVFGTMFYGSLRENTDQSIVLSDIQADIFSKLLKCIYADEAEIDSYETAFRLHYAAKKYMIDQLEKACIDYLLNKLQPSNALKFFKFAKFFEEQNLAEKALKVIREQTVSVIASDDFANVDISMMTTILEQNELQATEIELFEALESLAIKNDIVKASTQDTTESKNSSANEKDLELKESFRKAVKKIQFHSMTLEQFVNGPARSKLLLPNEALAICACLSKSSLLETLYPKDFAQNVRPPKNLPLVFFDFSVDGASIGRIVVQLRSDVVPKTVENFLRYCNNENSDGFKDCKLDNVNFKYLKKNSKSNADYTTSENHILKNKDIGSVCVLYKTDEKEISCVNSFGICLDNDVDLPHNVFIGRTVRGLEVLEKIKSYGTESGAPLKQVLIENCGVLKN